MEDVITFIVLFVSQKFLFLKREIYLSSFLGTWTNGTGKKSDRPVQYHAGLHFRNIGTVQAQNNVPIKLTTVLHFAKTALSCSTILKIGIVRCSHAKPDVRQVVRNYILIFDICLDCPANSAE